MTAIEVDILDGLPPEERTQQLLAKGEDQWFERKSWRVAPKDLGNEIAGMANAEGGLIVVGLHDGEVEAGYSVDRDNALRQAAADFTVPAVGVETRPLSVLDATGDEVPLLILTVPASTRIHANQRDEVYLRVGDETRRLRFAQRQELEFDKGQSNFETTHPRVVTYPTIEADALFAPELVAELLDSTGAKSTAGLLKARGLMSPDGALTVGALLLLGENPQAELPEAHTRVVRYQGTTRPTGARQRIEFDKRFDGPLPHQIRSAQEAIESLIPERRALGADGRFTSIGFVPRNAWLEALVNAVIHRSYSMAGDHCRVEIFDDRLEVESPGRFPGIVDVSQPLHVNRFARNPRIARIMADFEFGQELGEGIRRMFEEMRIAGLGDPEYRQTAGSVRVALRATAVDRDLEQRLPPNARQVLRAVRERSRASTGDLVAATGWSRPAVLKLLNSLQNEGLVVWVGNSKKDPRAYWKLPS